MRLKNILGIASMLAVAVIAVSCSGDYGKKYHTAIEDDQAGLYNASIEDDTYLELGVSYDNNATAGTSMKFERSFENAPPMIPHDTEGMFPITAEMNMCLSCHDRAVAEALMADTPNLKAIPASHYFSIRTAADTGDATKAETGDVLSNDRYNCDQCHVVQTNAKPVVKNLFQADFLSEGAKQGSNYKDTYKDGVVEEKIKTYGDEVK